jgi:hypothetical protein
MLHYRPRTTRHYGIRSQDAATPAAPRRPAGSDRIKATSKNCSSLPPIGPPKISTSSGSGLKRKRATPIAAPKQLLPQAGAPAGDLHMTLLHPHMHAFRAVCSLANRLLLHAISVCAPGCSAGTQRLQDQPPALPSTKSSTQPAAAPPSRRKSR